MLTKKVDISLYFFTASAGVGRTGTYIGIEAMLESAKEQGSVFIPNYLQVMRRQRPHMVQKDVRNPRVIKQAIANTDKQIRLD